MRLYAPVYISNECINGCVYCGFRALSSISRKTLSIEEIASEAKAVAERGHRHILLVSGENPHKVTNDFVCKAVEKIRPLSAGITVEIMPQDEVGYQKLFTAGVDGVTLYQETYDRRAYELFHPSGPKSDFTARLKAIDFAGTAGMRFLGIGALLGLSNWRRETIALVLHARWLMNRHWRAQISVSVPRIRDSAAGFKMPSVVTDAELAQMICALRLSLPDCGITLSTRENASLRESLIPLGVTQMSAGSVTSPGGHTDKNSGEQFSMCDTRSAQDVAKMLNDKGYEPIWKDWDAAFNRKQETENKR